VVRQPVATTAADSVSPVVNTFTPAAQAPGVRILSDTGLRVQAFAPPPPTQTVWERVRRLLFGAFSAQPGT